MYGPLVPAGLDPRPRMGRPEINHRFRCDNRGPRHPHEAKKTSPPETGGLSPAVGGEKVQPMATVPRRGPVWRIACKFVDPRPFSSCSLRVGAPRWGESDHRQDGTAAQRLVQARAMQGSRP